MLLLIVLESKKCVFERSVKFVSNRQVSFQLINKSTVPPPSPPPSP